MMKNTSAAWRPLEIVRSSRLHATCEAHLRHVARFQRWQRHALHELLRLGRVLALHPQRRLAVGRGGHGDQAFARA